MFFAILFAVLTTLAGSESHPPTAAPVRTAIEFAIFAAAVAFMPYAAGGLLLEHLQQRPFDVLSRRLMRSYRFVAPIWAAVMGPAVVYLTGWPAAARQLAGDGWLLDELLILTPVLLPFLLIWWMSAGMEHRLILRRDGVAPKRLALFGLQLRHFGGFLLAPIFFALAVGEFADRFEQQLQGREWIIPVVLLLGLVLLFPFVLRRIWKTEPMERGPLRERLEAATRRVGMRVREILVWRTHGCVVNAAVIGFAGLARYVLLTDELIALFEEDEVESILLHEAAHVRRRHLLLRLGLIGFPLFAIGVAFATLGADSSNEYASLTVFAAAQNDATWLTGVFWTAAAPLAIAAYCGVSLAWISRLLEFDADVWACRFQAEHRGESLGRARDLYIGMLERLAEVAGTPRNRRTWMHPSIGERVELLESLGGEETRVRQAEKTLRATVIVYLLLGAIPLCLAFWLGG